MTNTCQAAASSRHRIPKRHLYTCASIQNSNRNITTYFSGGHRVRDGAMLRPALEKQEASIGGYFKLLRHQVEKTGGEAQRDSLEQSYVSATLNARFRLVIAGDGPSTRGLWDAMLGGSTPVIVSNKWLPHLPFPKIFDWKALSVIVDSTAPSSSMFEHIKMAVREFDDATARAEVSKLWPYFVWGWGAPSSRWHHGEADGSYGHGLVTDIALTLAFEKRRFTAANQSLVWAENDRLLSRAT